MRISSEGGVKAVDGKAHELERGICRRDQRIPLRQQRSQPNLVTEG